MIARNLPVKVYQASQSGLRKSRFSRYNLGFEPPGALLGFPLGVPLGFPLGVIRWVVMPNAPLQRIPPFMARIGIIFGLLLCGLTIAGMSATTQKTYTQFVPMMFGIPMLFLGVVSLNPHRRAGSIFVAFVLSAIAMTLGGGRLLVLAMDRARGEYVNPISLRLVVMMTVLSLGFVLIAWLWQRRRTRDTASTNENSSPNSVSEPTSGTRTADSTPAFDQNPYQTPSILNEVESTSQSDSGEAERPVVSASSTPIGDSPLRTGELPPNDLPKSKSK